MMTTMTDDDDARDAQARGVTAGYREDVAEESFVVRGARGDARGRGETLDGWGRTSGLPSPRLGRETKTPRTPTTRLTEDAR